MISDFTDLNTWKKAHELVIVTYDLVKGFPKYELYSLGDQMRRAAVSITSNIAEGFGRESYKEKVNYYSMAEGSLMELKNQLIVARDVGFIEEKKVKVLLGDVDGVFRLLKGLKKSTRKHIDDGD